MNVGLAILGPVRVAMVAAALQAAAFRLRTPQIACKPKCSACCKRFMVVTLAEALVLVDHLKKNGKWTRVAAAAEEQRLIEANPVSWYKMGLACPLLCQDMCDAYQVRPVMCSAHFVTSSPEACSPTSTSFNRFHADECAEALATFAKAFDAAVGGEGSLRARVPMAVALLVAEKLLTGPKSKPEFDVAIAAIVKELRT
jgi:Fe-S-cluster containining protein